jgi:16S rRNA U516 pseudouridylate synthase RsuA-like enzyme
MCATVGLRVTRLRRVRMGPLLLGALPLGKWRELTKREVAALKVAR